MNLIGLLSFIWLVSLPFYHFSLVGSLSLDNMLAPLLFLLLVAGIFTRSIQLTSAQIRNLLWAGVTVLTYLLAHTVNLITTQTAVWDSINTIAKNMLYFILPIMFINSEDRLRQSDNAIIVVMLIGCTTALLSSLGVIHLGFARHAQARFGLSDFTKTVGFLTNYGDMGMLISISLLLVVGGRNSRVLFGKGSSFKILIVVFGALAGALAQQSRNLFLTVLVAFGAFVFLGYIRKQSSWRGRFYITLLSAIAFAAVIVTLFSGPLLSWVEHLGGTKEAAATVAARLSQYKFAWSLLQGRLLIGADPSVYQQDQSLIGFIHNMWLKELVEGGLPAMLATLWFYVRAVRNQAERFNTDPNSFEARSYLSLLVALLVATQFYPATTYIYWVLLGIATAQPRHLVEAREAAIDEPEAREARSIPRILRTARSHKYG